MVAKEKARWVFPLTGGGKEENWSTPEEETFRESGAIQALVREILQNSIDAWDEDADSPVKVSFQLADVPLSELPDLDGMKDSIESVREGMNSDQSNKIVPHISNMIKLLKRKTVKFLCIHDSNTVGAYSIDGTSNNDKFVKLVKGGSLNSAGAGGSYGIGSYSPYLATTMRSLFFYTRLDKNHPQHYQKKGNAIEKFQGAFRLTPHGDDKERKQGWGYYGYRKGHQLNPIVEPKEMPQWARTLRKEHLGKDCQGTTIYIPFYRFGEDEEPETIICVLANYFKTIIDGKLIVEVGNTRIDQSSIRKIYSEYESRLDTENDHLNPVHIKKCFAFNEAIISPSQRGVRYLNKGAKGKIDYFIRLHKDMIDKSNTVAISRKNGMLLTYKPEKLQRFPKYKPFRLFIQVTGSANDDLRQLENPQHDQFILDHLSDLANPKQVEATYDDLVDQVKSILDEHAFIDMHETQVIDDEDLMMDLSGDNDSEGGENDSSKRRVIKGAIHQRHRQKPIKPGNKGNKEANTGGFQGGKRKKGDKSAGPNTGESKGRGVESIVAESLKLFYSDSNVTCVFKLGDIDTNKIKKINLKRVDIAENDGGAIESDVNQKFKKVGDNIKVIFSTDKIDLSRYTYRAEVEVTNE